jgi:hypothetical protein
MHTLKNTKTGGTVTRQQLVDMMLRKIATMSPGEKRRLILAIRAAGAGAWVDVAGRRLWLN